MDTSKLAKILSRAASDNDTEALGALRSARRMLEQAGYDFIDVANAVDAPTAVQRDLFDRIDVLEEALATARDEIRQLRVENRRLKVQSRIPAPPPHEAPIDLQNKVAELSEQLLRLETDWRHSQASNGFLREEMQRLELNHYREIADLKSAYLRAVAKTSRNKTTPDRQYCLRLS